MSVSFLQPQNMNTGLQAKGFVLEWAILDGMHCIEPRHHGWRTPKPRIPRSNEKFSLENGYRFSPQMNAVSDHFEVNDSAPAGGLIGPEHGSFEFLHPVRTETAMGGSCNRIFVYPDRGREKAGDEIELRVSRSSRDYNSARFDFFQTMEIRIEFPYDIVRREFDEIIELIFSDVKDILPKAEGPGHRTESLREVVGQCFEQPFGRNGRFLGFGGEIQFNPAVQGSGGEASAPRVECRLIAGFQKTGFRQHMRRGERGMAAQIHFDPRREPAQAPAVRFFQ